MKRRVGQFGFVAACVLASAACVDVIAGAACSTDADCSGAVCVGQMCTRPLPVGAVMSGGACMTNADCRGLTCIDEVCTNVDSIKNARSANQCSTALGLGYFVSGVGCLMTCGPDVCPQFGCTVASFSCGRILVCADLSTRCFARGGPSSMPSQCCSGASGGNTVFMADNQSTCDLEPCQ